MKNDLYLKTVLTIIAICLSIIVLDKFEFIKKANASQNVPFDNYRVLPVNEDGTVSVRLLSTDEINVNITGINTHDELDINIDEIGGGYLSHGGPIPVEIEQ